MNEEILGFGGDPRPEPYLATRLDRLLVWARRRSLAELWAGACCGRGQGNAAAGRELALSPRHADVLIVSGIVTHKQAPRLHLLYEQIPRPRHVVAFGACACSGGAWSLEAAYGVLEGVDLLLPVDVYVPGCPPSTEALALALQELQDLHDGLRRREPWRPSPVARAPAQSRGDPSPPAPPASPREEAR